MSSSSSDSLIQASSTDTFWKQEHELLSFMVSSYHDPPLRTPPLGQPGINSEESPTFSESPDEQRVDTPIGDLVSPELAKESMHEKPQAKEHPFPTIDLQSPAQPRTTPENAHYRIAPLPIEILRHGIFPKNVPKPSVIVAVPVPIRTQVTSSLQLACCVSLLPENSSHGTVNSSDDAGEENGSNWPWRDWFNAIRKRPTERRYLRHLVSRMVQAFLEGDSQDFSLIAEVSLLGPVLNQVDYHTLLTYFLENFKRSEAEPILESQLLQVIIRLIQTASPGTLTNKIVFKMLAGFRLRLEDSRTLSETGVHLLVFTIAKLLEVMVDGKVAVLNRQKDYQILLDVLNRLKALPNNSFFRFNIDYACQAILYLSGNGTPLQTLLNPAESLPTEASPNNKTVKLELEPALIAIGRLQQATTASDTGHRIVEGNIRKEPWHLALQAASIFVRDGRMVEFSQLVGDVECRFEPNFQHGICQILAEVAADPHWNLGNRRRAVDFLGQLFRTDTRWRRDSIIANWITTVTTQDPVLDSSYIIIHARLLLEELQQEYVLEVITHYPLSSMVPLLESSPLLIRSQNLLQREDYLVRQLAQRTGESYSSTYIPLHAKSSAQDSDSNCFPLMREVEHFLESERLVFLILGDAGSGKSTFCRHLERFLWSVYKPGDRIPLYIDLPSIDQPDYDLIEKQLRQHSFSGHEIHELLRLRKFVLICDGYDESRLTTNLYYNNQLNPQGQQDVKMIIACRNVFLTLNYVERFLPQAADHYRGSSSHRFQEATIVPFTLADIAAIVEQTICRPSELGTQPISSISTFMDTIHAIPNMEDLVKNPFLLALALEIIPSLSLSLNAPDDTQIEATRLQLYDRFIKNWIQANRARLRRSVLRQDVLAAFETLCEADFELRMMDFLKELAKAIYDHQDGAPVVEYIQTRDGECWKASFFGPAIEPTLLREASPLSRDGIQHKFIHHSWLEYFYSLTLYDPATDGEEDSHGGGDGPDDNGDDSQGGGNGGAGSQGGGAGSDGGGGRSGGKGGASGDNSNSDGNKGGSGGDKEDSRRGKDGSHSKGKGTSARSGSAALMDRFSKRNLFKEPGVLQFLVERAQSDTRLKTRLWTIIEQAKSALVPSLAAANAITILFKSGERFHNDSKLSWIPIPRDYISEESFNPAYILQACWTGAELLGILLELADPTAIGISSSSSTTLAAPTGASFTEFMKIEGEVTEFRPSSPIGEARLAIESIDEERLAIQSDSIYEERPAIESDLIDEERLAIESNLIDEERLAIESNLIDEERLAIQSDPIYEEIHAFKSDLIDEESLAIESNSHQSTRVLRRRRHHGPTHMAYDFDDLPKLRHVPTITMPVEEYDLPLFDRIYDRKRDMQQEEASDDEQVNSEKMRRLS